MLLLLPVQLVVVNRQIPARLDRNCVCRRFRFPVSPAKSIPRRAAGRVIEVNFENRGSDEITSLTNAMAWSEVPRKVEGSYGTASECLAGDRR